MARTIHIQWHDTSLRTPSYKIYLGLVHLLLST